jgi:hypothetical protein
MSYDEYISPASALIRAQWKCRDGMAGLPYKPYPPRKIGVYVLYHSCISTQLICLETQINKT